MENTAPPNANLDFLRAHALFGGLEDKDLMAILPFLKRKNYDTGQIIVREGSLGRSLYFILEGRAAVLKQAAGSPSGTALRLAEMGPGDTFGEMELIDVQARSATVRAAAPVKALALTNQDLYRIHQSRPFLYTMIILNLAREISRRLRRADEELARLRNQLSGGRESEIPG